MEELYKAINESLSPEAKVLILCARTRVSAVETRQIRALVQDGIDWDSLVDLAYEHQVAPLLYRTLDAVAPAAMPEEVRADLKRHIQVYIQGNLSLTQELILLMKLFEQHSISAIPYKGPVLAASVYHDLSIRSFGDLDILVHEEDVLKAIDLLISAGYEIIRPNSVTRTSEELQPYWIQRLIYKSPWGYQVVLWNPDRKGIVELHWRVTPRFVFAANPKRLWKDLQPVTLGGSTLLSLAPENMLWYLCLHGTKHKWKELRWMCDVAELIREYPNLDWQKVRASAAELGVERRLYLGLALSQNIMGASLPEEIAAKIEALPAVRKLEKEVLGGFLNVPVKTPGYSKIKRLAYQLEARDRLADKVRYLLRFFKRLDTIMTTQRKFIRSFSFLALSSRLQRLRM